MWVVIATSGLDPLVLRRTLESLGDCRKPDPYRGCLVVENGGRGRARQVCDTAPKGLNITYCRIETTGKNRALNHALSRLGDALVVFLDDDVRVSEGFLVAYENASRLHGRGFYYGGPFGVDYEKPPPEWLKRFLPPSAIGNTVAPKVPTGGGVAYFLGFNWAAFVNDLLACGGFNEALGPGESIPVGDESLMQELLTRHGIKGQWVKDAMAWHHVPRKKCTPWWTLKRTFSTGSLQGVDLHHMGLAHFRRMIRWRVRKKDLARFFSLRRDGLFWCCNLVMWFLGVARGYLLGLKH